MTIHFYPASGLTGGASGDLDALDGALLNQGDAALVIGPEGAGLYLLDAASGQDENPPAVVRPDRNPGEKRWVLQEVCAMDFISPTGAGLGTLSRQDAASVDIDGGSLDGVTLGADSPCFLADGCQPPDDLISSLGGAFNQWLKVHTQQVGRPDTGAFLSFTGSYVVASTVIRPQTDGYISLGASSYRWQNIFAVNGVIQTSDANQKEQAVPTPLGLDFIKRLAPKQFKWKDAHVHAHKHRHRHHGFLAQDVERVLEDMAVDSNDFGGLFRDEKTGAYGLRYHEFLAPMVRAIQELEARVGALEAAT